MGQIPTPGGPVFPKSGPEWWRYSSIKSSVTSFGAAAVDPLLAALGNPNPAIRYDAVEILGEIRESRTAIPLLLAAVNDKSGEVRIGAADSFFKLPLPTDTTLLDAIRSLDLRSLDEDQVLSLSIIIRLGIPGSESTLIDAFNYFGSFEITGNHDPWIIDQGTKALALGELFLNSGNQALIDAAYSWADNHGYKIKSEKSYGSQPAWGSR